MQTHTALGRDAIQAAEDMMDARVSFLRFAKGDRLRPPGVLGWQRLSRGSQGRHDSGIGPPHGGGRRL